MDYKQVLQMEQKLGLFTTWTNWEKKVFTPTTIHFMLLVNILVLRPYILSMVNLLKYQRELANVNRTT